MFVPYLLQPGNLTAVFHPIVDFGGERQVVKALEALTRGPAGGQFERASVLFDYVRLQHEEVRFDRHCTATALAAASRLPGTPDIHLNVHAVTLERDPVFATYLQTAATANEIDPARLTVELLEQSPCFDVDGLLRAVRQLRACGVKIAIDDFGLGNGNFAMVVDIVPECLKIDRYLVAGCTADRYRRSAIRSILHMAADTGAAVIAVGIESADDLRTLRDLGLTMGQGFLFGRPTAHPSLSTTASVPQLIPAHIEGG